MIRNAFAKMAIIRFLDKPLAAVKLISFSNGIKYLYIKNAILFASSVLAALKTIAPSVIAMASTGSLIQQIARSACAKKATFKMGPTLTANVRNLN